MNKMLNLFTTSLQKAISKIFICCLILLLGITTTITSPALASDSTVAAADAPCSQRSKANLIDFNSAETVNAPAEPISIAGVTVSFEGLRVIKVDSERGGFAGAAGKNQVIPSDRTNFNGRFLTGRANLNDGLPKNYRRVINFSQPVNNVCFFIADIDVNDGIKVNVLDSEGQTLDSQYFPASIDADAALTTVDLTKLEGVKTIEVIGNDPIGIDNLSFGELTQLILPPCQSIKCSEFASQKDAQAVFDALPDDRFGLDPDGNGIACEDLISSNRPPEVANTISNQRAQTNSPFSYRIPDNTFSDPDGDNLTLSATGLPSWLSFDSNTNTFSGNTPAQKDIYRIEVTADDGKGGTVSTVLRIFI